MEGSASNPYTSTAKKNLVNQKKLTLTDVSVRGFENWLKSLDQRRISKIWESLFFSSFVVAVKPYQM